MKRSELYMKKTVKQLFEMYADENLRINQDDAKTTKDNIMIEMYRRLIKVLTVIDNNENVNLDSLYEEYIQPIRSEDV